jgi:hypothetical protein
LPSGLVILTVPAFKVLWTYHDDLNHHLTRYTKRSFRRIARQAGLEIREARYLYHWTWPVKLGVRALEGLAQTKPNPPRIPPSWANEALFRLSRFEQKTLSALPMPFGSSLLVVAGKAAGVRSRTGEPVQLTGKRRWAGQRGGFDRPRPHMILFQRVFE